MDEWMNRWMDDGWMEGWRDGGMEGWRDGGMEGGRGQVPLAGASHAITIMLQSLCVSVRLLYKESLTERPKGSQ